MPNLREWDITLNTSGGFRQILNFLGSFDKMPFFCPLPPFKSLFESAKRLSIVKRSNAPFLAGVSASSFHLLLRNLAPCNSRCTHSRNPLKEILSCGSQLHTFSPENYWGSFPYARSTSLSLFKNLISK